MECKYQEEQILLVNLTTQGVGVFVTTGDQPVIATLRFISNSGELDRSSAVLRIMTT